MTPPIEDTASCGAFPCATSDQPSCATGCPECRQAPITEAELARKDELASRRGRTLQELRAELAHIHAGVEALPNSNIPEAAHEYDVIDRAAALAVIGGAQVEAPAVIDAVHIARQREFSTSTFGPGARTTGVVSHIRCELFEILADPADVTEWADVVILAIDGAWRAGHEPQAIIDAIVAKQARNEARTWPDWRGVPEGQPIEHVRGGDDDRS